eukprot:6724026-Pyramimonas_sp.AAC.1
MDQSDAGSTGLCSRRTNQTNNPSGFGQACGGMVQAADTGGRNHAGVDGRGYGGDGRGCGVDGRGYGVD